jgi:hypothetical protein
MIKKVTFSKRTGRFKSGQPASKKIKEEGARENIHEKVQKEDLQKSID